MHLAAPSGRLAYALPSNITPLFGLDFVSHSFTLFHCLVPTLFVPGRDSQLMQFLFNALTGTVAGASL